MMYLVDKHAFTVAQVNAIPVNNVTVKVAEKERCKDTVNFYYADTIEEAIATIKELKRKHLIVLQEKIGWHERQLSYFKSRFEDLKNSI
jgi:vancomycin permeability regulator SanA